VRQDDRILGETRLLCCLAASIFVLYERVEETATAPTPVPGLQES
jgi:hypothetical protein